jgi:hypothetical protein
LILSQFHLLAIELASVQIGGFGSLLKVDFVDIGEVDDFGIVEFGQKFPLPQVAHHHLHLLHQQQDIVVVL